MAYNRARTGLPGEMLSLNIPNPAAAAEISYILPAGFEYKVHAVKFRVVTAGGGGTREPRLVYTDGANELIRHKSSGTAGGLTHDYYWGIGLPLVGVGADLSKYAPILAETRLPAGFTIGTNTLLWVAGDQFSAIYVTLERWRT